MGIFEVGHESLALSRSLRTIVQEQIMNHDIDLHCKYWLLLEMSMTRWTTGAGLAPEWYKCGETSSSPFSGHFVRHYSSSPNKRNTCQTTRKTMEVVFYCSARHSSTVPGPAHLFSFSPSTLLPVKISGSRIYIIYFPSPRGEEFLTGDQKGRIVGEEENQEEDVSPHSGASPAPVVHLVNT